MIEAPIFEFYFFKKRTYSQVVFPGGQAFGLTFALHTPGISHAYTQV